MSRALIVSFFVLTSAACVQGAKKVEFNVDLFCGWDGYYRPMEWTPAEVGIGSNLTEPFEGSFTLSAQQDGLNTMNVVHTFVLTPDEPLSLRLVSKFAFGVGECEMTIRDKRGRTQWQHEINMWDFSTANRLLRVIQEEDLLVGVLGQSRFGLLRLPGDTICMSDRGQGKVYIGTKVTRMVPWDWTGFVSLDVLVLYDPDWGQLRSEQLKAIARWVSNGGTLLLILGQHPLSRENPLSELLPFQIGELKEVAVGAEALDEWGLDSNLSETVTAWPLTAKPGALVARKIDAPDGTGLYGLGYAGFGRVAVLGFDPAGLREEQVRHSARFWTKHIAACLDEPADASAVTRRTRQPMPPEFPRQVTVGSAGRRTISLAENASDDPGRQNDNRYSISLAQGASNQVMEHLYQLRQMRPLSIWWIILTLASLAILLGPVDYLVLKRLDRLPYTWLTSVGWIIVFTVGAYYGVQELRGGSMQLRAVSVLDGVADSNHAWATYYTGLFAPRSDDYRLTDLRGGQWWSGIAPSREELYTFQHEPGSRQIYCVQADGSNLPMSLPINIWTVQSLLGECPLDGMPFAATAKHKDGNIVVEIDNTSDSAIAAGFVLTQHSYIEFGPVAARSRQTFERPALPFNAWQEGPQYQYYRGARPPMPGLWYTTPRYPSGWAQPAQHTFMAQGCLARTLTMHACLRLGAALVCVMFDKAPAPFGVEDRSYDTNHIQYARLLVLPGGS